MTPIKSTRLSGGTKALAKVGSEELEGVEGADPSALAESPYKKRAQTAIAEYKDVQLGAADIAKNTMKWLGNIQGRFSVNRDGSYTGMHNAKYEDWMADKAFAILTDPTIVAPKSFTAVCLGVSRATLNRWCKDDTKDAFGDAIACGVAVQEAQLATMMRGGFKYSNNLFAILKNLHDWKDRTEETQVKIDVAGIIKEIETGAPHVDWDREQVIDAEVIEATAHAKGDDDVSQRTHHASSEATHAPSSEANIPTNLGAS